MNFDGYQRLAARTMNSEHGKYALANYALGLVGELGELRLARSEEDRVLELGDALWYLAAMFTELDLRAGGSFSPETVRPVSGFNPERVAELVKKHVFHGVDKRGEIVSALLELMDAIASIYGYLADRAMIENIEKLKKRHPDGFSSDYKD